MTNDVTGILKRAETLLQQRGPDVLIGLAIFAAFWVAARITSGVIRRAAARADESRRDVILLLGRTARVTIVIVGAVMALSNIGVNVNALVAGLGLSGFALGFALRDALSNVLAGVLIIMYRPFQRGDVIGITGLQGRVLSIDLRYTILDCDGKSVLIPNTTVFNNTITVIQRVAS